MPVGTKVNVAPIYRSRLQVRTTAEDKQALTLVELMVVTGSKRAREDDSMHE
jgi:hypothetical protein